MDEVQQIKETWNFINKAISQEFEETKDFWNFTSKFIEKYRAEEAKLPYHINLIDELHADENAHSRILAKLLQQKTPYGKHEILEIFVQYLKEKSIFFENIQIKHPDITQETERIDLWVQDKIGGYAIIIENKIHWAGDQEEQLSRYINKTIGKGFEEKQIYVIYLTSTYCYPNDQSWGIYKDKLEDRYLNLSYREDILPWLMEKVLPNVRLKDKFLSSALEQYIDHLEGMFDLRTINNKMNMELQEFIKKELGLTENPQENITKLNAKQEEINKVSNQIQLLIDNVEKEIFQKWKEFLKTKYPYYKEIEIYGAGLVIPLKDTSVQVTLSIYAQELYCQVDSQHLEDNELPKEVVEKVGKFLPRKQGKNTIWNNFPRYAYDETFKVMLEIIQILISKE